METTVHGLVWLSLGFALVGCPADEDADTDGGGSTSTTGAPGTASTTTPSSASAGSSSATSVSGTESGGGSSESGDPGTTGTATSSTTTSADSSSSTGTSAVCGEDPIVGTDSAVAVLYGDLPPIGMTGSTTIGGPEDDWLWVRIASFSVDCKDPRGDSACEEGVEKWYINMIIPPANQMPGEYSFEDLNVFLRASDGTMCDGMMSTTTGGGGGTPEGTVYIDEIGPEGIVGCIATDAKDGFDPNGSFSAVNCSE